MNHSLNAPIQRFAYRANLHTTFHCHKEETDTGMVPVLVIPLDKPRDLMEKVAKACYRPFGLHKAWDDLDAWERDEKRKDAKRALFALGIVVPSPSRKRVRSLAP